MHPNDGLEVSNFICQALHNEPITIYGDGTQTRSFCYVDNPKQRCPDTSLAVSKLSWEPEIQLRESLKMTLSYFDELLKH